MYVLSTIDVRSHLVSDFFVRVYYFNDESKMRYPI